MACNLFIEKWTDLFIMPDENRPRYHMKRHLNAITAFAAIAIGYSYGVGAGGGYNQGFAGRTITPEIFRVSFSQG